MLSMIKRVLFIFVLFSLHILLVNSANIDINSCQALTTGNTYIVTSGFSATGNCLTLPNTPFDIIIDLGGYTMTGNGTGYGIYFLVSHDIII